MHNILLVCLGNICRSPLAEGILKNKVNATNVFVDSAGTGGYHIGNPPDPRSIIVAKKDNSNYDNVISLAQSEAQHSKVKLLLQEVDLKITEVPDPYYGGDEGFENVYTMIEAACEAIALKLKS